MSKLVWDQDGQRQYEAGVDHCVLYTYNSTNSKWEGVAWNGITSITESPEGADETELWADNIKYGGIRSAEKYGGTIEAYTWPDEFEECDGMAELGSTGIRVGQQTRKPFRLAYRTNISNDQNPDAGYKYHVVYGATCKPSEESHETINDNPDAATYSWDFDTTPVKVSGLKPTSHLEFSSLEVSSANLKKLEDILFGRDADATANPAVTALDPTCPDPDALLQELS